MINYSGYNKSKVNFSIYYYVNTIFKKIEFGLFISLCLVLIFTSKVNKKVSDDISMFFVNISMPIVKSASYPFNTAIDLATNLQELVNAGRENKVLKEENNQLKSLYIKALNIAEENKELKNILNFIGLRSIQYKSAQIIGGSHQLYNNTVLIDAGLNHGLKEDDIIMGKSSVIGRIKEVSETKSRVMLVTDINSRIPIITSQSRSRGILAGNNSNLMEILYLSKKHNVEVGDLVYTAGDGEYLPPGLLIGMVKKVDKDYVAVAPAEDVNDVNIVSIVKY